MRGPSIEPCGTPQFGCLFYQSGCPALISGVSQSAHRFMSQGANQGVWLCFSESQNHSSVLERSLIKNIPQCIGKKPRSIHAHNAPLLELSEASQVHLQI